MQATEPVKGKWQKLSFYRRLEGSNWWGWPPGPPLLFGFPGCWLLSAPHKWRWEVWGVPSAALLVFHIPWLLLALADLILLMEAQGQVLCQHGASGSEQQLGAFWAAKNHLLYSCFDSSTGLLLLHVRMVWVRDCVAQGKITAMVLLWMYSDIPQMLWNNLLWHNLLESLHELLQHF